MGRRFRAGPELEGHYGHSWLALEWRNWARRCLLLCLRLWFDNEFGLLGPANVGRAIDFAESSIIALSSLFGLGSSKHRKFLFFSA